MDARRRGTRGGRHARARKAVIGRGAVNQNRAAIGVPPPCTRSAAPARSCRSTSCWSPRARRRSARRTSAARVLRPEVQAAYAKCCDGIFMPGAEQSLDGNVTHHARRQGNRRARARLDCRDVGARTEEGRPLRARARVDSPAWRLVQALNTLVSADGDRRSTGCPTARPTATGPRRCRRGRAPERREGRQASARRRRTGRRRRWREAQWSDLAPQAHRQHPGAGERLHRTGGKTILPHRAVAKSTCGSYRHEEGGRRWPS